MNDGDATVIGVWFGDAFVCVAFSSYDPRVLRPVDLRRFIDMRWRS